ncbi:hypothetical protein ACQ4PT_019922 [Festuca glaucescens]
MVVKIYEFPGPLPVQILKSWIKFPTCPAIFRIYRDTATVVIISYVLLLDINLSYLSLCIFPLIAIGFIYALFRELCNSVEHHGEGVNNSGSGRAGIEPNYTGKTKKEPEELEFIVMMPFCALCALCLMAHLDDRPADRFAVSQFLLFLSSTLGVLTRMMIRLPSGASTDVTPASVLLQKSFLLLLFVTVHTVAAEALGEDVVLVCMPEVVPMLLWFSVHLDRESSIVSVDKIKPYTDFLFAFIAAVIALLAYLATSMDESWLSSCTEIMVACGVSGLLTYYVVFMLHQWPGKQSAINDNVAASIRIHDRSLQYEKQRSKDKGAAVSLEVVVQSKEQHGSSEEVMQLLRFWANALLIAATSLLLLKYIVSRRLGLQEPLLDALCQNFRLC